MRIIGSQRMKNSDGHFLAIQQEKIKKILSEGGQVINLGRGNPDLPTFPEIVEVFEKFSKDEQNHGYPPYGGKESLKESIIDFYRDEYQVELEKDEVTVFSGSLSALTALPMALVNPGENVLTPNPSFFGYQTGVRMAEGNSVEIDLLEENNYLPVFKNISQETLKNTKLMFLNYPHNPTGAGATKDFFEEVVKFAIDNDIVVAHDFAYADISFEKNAPSFLQATRAKEVGVEIYTLSKTFNMAGWRIAFAVGNRDIISLLNNYIRSSVGGTFGAIQDAVAFGLTHSSEERKALKECYDLRRELVLDRFSKNNIQIYKSSGTFFLWLKLPENFKDDIEFANKLLEEEKVALVAGSTFGRAGEGYVRISLVSDIPVLMEGTERIIRFFEKIESGSTYARS